jgi:hypothetical protein
VGSGFTLFPVQTERVDSRVAFFAASTTMMTRGAVALSLLLVLALVHPGEDTAPTAACVPNTAAANTRREQMRERGRVAGHRGRIDRWEVRRGHPFACVVG